MHLGSLRNAHIRTLWEDDVHPHYVMRRYAEFTASLIQLNVDYGDGQVRNTNLLSTCKSLTMFTLTVRLAISFLYFMLNFSARAQLGKNATGCG